MGRKQVEGKAYKTLKEGFIMISKSAIMFFLPDSEDPIIITGLRHPDVLEKVNKLNIPWKSKVEGFLTDDKQFVDRYEAKYIARDCGQIVEETSYLELYSEDIWPE